MSASIGVLMIGSLYWEQKTHRKSWRDERLETASAVHVRAPIRYGRVSSTRGNIYTMVFSEELERSRDKLGSAVVVPCKRAVRSPCHLIEEAEALWRAEQRPDSSAGGISAKWGSAVIIQNPSRPLRSRVLRAWVDRVAREDGYGDLSHSNDEGSLFGTDGQLSMSWPVDAPSHYSALLATATNPSLIKGGYPSVDQIADALKTPEGSKHRYYFDHNRINGIRTFQDEEIAQRLDDGSA